MPRDLLAVERAGERAVLLKGRLRRALFRLNPWLTEDGAERAIFRLEHVEAIGLAHYQLVHEYLTYGLSLEVEERGGRPSRQISFFAFDHPEPIAGRNDKLNELAVSMVEIARRRLAG